MARFVITALLGFLLAFSSAALAQSAQEREQAEAGVAQLNVINDPMANRLPIEGQRFRIDDNIKEITLLFFRERGSSPLILIKPDGSKWYEARHPIEKVTWYTNENFDMIRIKEPMPGPWQVAGRVDEQNEAVIVSDIKFQAQPLPTPLYENEHIKVEGTLYNGEHPVKTARFHETVILDVLFVSTNNADFDNFGVDPQRIGQFSDNGRGYDEHAGDGTFTSRFQLNITPGQYLPTYELTTPLYDRSYETDPVVVEASPVSFEMKLAEQAERDHQLVIKIDDERIKQGSVAINGQVDFPNGEQRTFSLTDIEKSEISVPIANLDYGKHLVDMTIFATNQQGREFELVIDDYSFISSRPGPEPPSKAEQLAAKRAALEQERIEKQRQLDEQESQAVANIIIIIAINLILLLLGVGAIWFLKKRSAKPKSQDNGKND
ncbi:TIGR03503 family protein [Idiomarina sp. MD25a]|uniref:TIGR03503 family protein n=1 Tax=Idiomarina sp. MD25a TaxID=1889913 RepID=UPI0008F8DE15|nr:TIGR03503 family protein [Idiomarina sp. MD25a]OIN01790.1 TIGR03503 family protein [Idiomarina sp. MD25a]